MKIRRGFISNSSSSSFLLTLESQAKSIDAFVEAINLFFQDYINRNQWRDDFVSPPLIKKKDVLQVKPGEYTIKGFLINLQFGESDLPLYISELLAQDSPAIEQYGFKDIEFNVIDEADMPDSSKEKEDKS